MELALIELKFNVKALLNTDFHFDRIILFRFFFCITHYELFLFSDTIVASVDDNINVVTKTDCYSSVGLVLAFNAIKLEIVRGIITYLSRRL